MRCEGVNPGPHTGPGASCPAGGDQRSYLPAPPRANCVPSRPDLLPPASPTLPDESTADRPQRFEALVAGFGRLVAHAVRQVAGGAAANDLDDIEQDVLLALWKRVGAEQDIEHPASYVYKAAIREAVRAVARVRRRAEEPLPEAEPEAEAGALRQETTGEQLVAERERREVLRAALAALPPDRARAVRAHLAGWSVDEVMRLHGWSYQRARNLIARGMADLRLELRSRGMS
jgi:RNA polymerase sigma factor (sigma-70 family)